MTDARRNSLAHVSQWLLLGACAVMVIGYTSTMLAQVSQDAINATLTERQVALSARLDKIESMLQYGIFGVFSNLIATLFSVAAKRGK